MVSLSNSCLCTLNYKLVTGSLLSNKGQLFNPEVKRSRYHSAVI